MSEVKIAEAAIVIAPQLDFKSFETGARTIGQRLESVSKQAFKKLKHSIKEDLHEISRNFISGGVLATISAMVEKVSAQFDEVTQKTSQYFALFDTLQDTAMQFGTNIGGMQLSYAVAGAHNIDKDLLNRILTMWQEKMSTLSPQEYSRYSKMSANEGFFRYLSDMQASGFSQETITKNLAYLLGNRIVVKLMDLANADIGKEILNESKNPAYKGLITDSKTMGEAQAKLLLTQSHAETQALHETARTLRGKNLEEFIAEQREHLETQNKNFQDQLKDIKSIAAAQEALEKTEHLMVEALTKVTKLLNDIFNWGKDNAPGIIAKGRTNPVVNGVVKTFDNITTSTNRILQK